jgi:hypothetical protein
MKENYNGCTSCLRIFMIIANMLFFAVGAGVAAIFIYMQVMQVDFVSAVLGTDLVVAANSLMIAGGCLLLVAAIVGIGSVISRTPCAIATEFVLLFFVFLSLIAGIVTALVFRTWLTDEVRHGMENTLIQNYGVDARITTNWDKAQYMWKCCAVDDKSWSIYQKSEWYKQQPGTPGTGVGGKPFVPPSCCVLDTSGNITAVNLAICQTTTDGPPATNTGVEYAGTRINPALHYRGCLQSAQDYLLHDNLSWFTVLIVIGSVAAGLVLIGMCISLAFCMSRKRQVRTEKTLVIDDTNAQMLHNLNQPMY